MTLSPTTHLGIEQLEAGTASPEIVVNEALVALDAHVERYVPDTTVGFRAVEEFLGGLLSNGGPFAIATTGAGAGYAGLLASDAGHPGLSELSTGTTTTGACSCVTKSAAAVQFGADAWKLRAVLRVPTLSDGTNTFTVFVGFADSQTTDAQTDGAFFQYTHGSSSGNWEAVTVSNTTDTVTDTGVAVVAGTWYRLEVAVSAAGVATFSIKSGTGDLALEATHSTNVPTGSARATGVMVGVVKAAGTTARTIEVDLLDVQCVFGVPR